MINLKTISTVLVASLILLGCGAQPDPKAIETLRTTKPASISPTGELAGMFFYGTDSTDLQREAKLKELEGVIVRWNLTVFDVKKISEDRYLVSTGRDPGLRDPLNNPRIVNSEVGTQVTLSILGLNDLQELAAYKTGDRICIKGKLTGKATFRHLEIKPAILCKHDTSRDEVAHTPAVEKPDPKPVVSEDNCHELMGLLYRAEKLMELCPQNAKGYVREGLLYAPQIDEGCGSSADPRYANTKEKVFTSLELEARDLGKEQFCKEHRPYGS